MIIDIFATIDNDPVKMKLPLLPFTGNAFRIPLFAIYEPQTLGWPNDSWYFTTDMEVSAVLIGGSRFMFDDSPGDIPETGMYKIYVDTDATYLTIGFNPETLWMYERPLEIIATSKKVLSLYGSKDPDGDANEAMIITAPSEIKKKADALKYARMSFESIKLRQIKNKESIYLYGGQFILEMRHKDIMENPDTKEFNLGKYLMTQIDHDMNEVAINGIDYRYLLNTKFPSKTFSEKETYNGFSLASIEDKYIGKIIPEVIGIGNGIPGICLNGKQIYDKNNLDENGDWKELERYTYRFPPGWIARPLKIEVKMNGNGENIGGRDKSFNREVSGWTEVYPGLGNPEIRNEYQTSNPLLTDADVDNARKTGLLTIDYRQCLANAKYGNDVLEVRMFAVWPNTRMEDAFTYLLSRANTAAMDLSLSCQSEFHNQLANIGLYMDSAESVFTWIEKLQAANIIGGQLFLINDVLTYRLENPNRNKKLVIPQTDVLNHETLSIGIAEDFMYSGYDIVWKKTHSGESEDEGHAIGVNYHYPMAAILNAEDATVAYTRSGSGSSLNEGWNTNALNRRISIIKDLLKTLRHKITGLKLPMSHDYLDLEIFDVIEYMPKVLENTEKELYEWIIYQKRINIKEETITFDLVERVKTIYWNNGNP